jgi:hypothetical protein
MPELARRLQFSSNTKIAAAFLLLGCAFFTMRGLDLWRDPYQAGRIWQSFDIAHELKRVHGVPWKTEISTMSGGTKPAPFLQEFPLSQYAICLLNISSRLTIAEAGQLISELIAVLCVMVWLRYAWSLPLSTANRVLVSGFIFFVPGFLRYGLTAVPDATVFLINLTAAYFIISGRRGLRDGLVTLGAILLGFAVLIKGPTLLPAVVIGFALLREKRWRSAACLCAASIPGIAWAALAHSVNKAAQPVDEMARVGMLREWWWNPRLYDQFWWYRNLSFTIYNTLGLFGIMACIWIVFSVPRRALTSFEFILMIGPAVAMFAAFNYHSATHAYYSLIWLPCTMAGAVELALKIPKRENLRFSHAFITGSMICLAIFTIAERQMGLVERTIARNADAAQPLFHRSKLGPETDPRDLLEHAALLGVKNRASFVAYFGTPPDAEIAFSELGIRGWVVRIPAVDPNLTPQAPHVPASVAREAEWRRVNANWFIERLNRGMDSVLIETAGTPNTAEVVQWAEDAGLHDVPEDTPGYILLLKK